MAIGASAAKATFTLTLSAPTTKAVTVHYTTSNGTAIAGTGYSAASGSVTFAPMQTTATIPVNVAGLAGGGTANTSFSLNLSTPSSNATLGQATGTATITYAAPTVILAPVSQAYVLGQSITFSAAARRHAETHRAVAGQHERSQLDQHRRHDQHDLHLHTDCGHVGLLVSHLFANVGGTVATASATLTLNTTPAVLSNPISQAVNTGTTVTFTAAASGTPVPTVQWQTSTDGVHWINISGETSTKYQVTAAAATAGHMYRALFTNSLGTSASNPATLTVYAPPAITSNPVSQSVAVGSQVTFTAAAGGTPAPSVQWQTSTNGTTWTNIAGTTSNSYTFTVTAAMSGHEYQAMFTNSHGLYSITTAATLTVSSPAAVTTNPVNQSAIAGSTVTFTATASGATAPTVQWQSSTDGSTWNNISGATSASYSFTATTAASGTQYRAVFTNSLGTDTTTAATLSVNTAPVVTTNPTSRSVAPGASASFTAAATGATSTQWQSSTNGGSTWSNIAGATSATYTVTTTTAMSGYEYRAQFSNSYGSVTTTAATLTVGAAPVITTNPASKTVGVGASVTLTAAASGSPAPALQWQTSANGTTWTNISGATSASYTFTATATMTGYQYQAVFTNSSGTATTTAATLTVNMPPVVTTNPTSQSVSAGAQATFTAAATDATTLSVQWQLSNNGTTWTNISGATSTSYAVTASAAMSGSQYRAVFTDTSGLTATTSAAMLTVLRAPVVTTNPAAETASAGVWPASRPQPAAHPRRPCNGRLAPTAARGTTSAARPRRRTPSRLPLRPTGTSIAPSLRTRRAQATTSAARLTVVTMPVVTTNPTSQSVAAGTTVELHGRRHRHVKHTVAVEHQRRRRLEQHLRCDRSHLQRCGHRDDVGLPVPRFVHQRVRLGDDFRRHADRRHSHHDHVQPPKRGSCLRRVGDLHNLGRRQSRTTVQWQVSSNHAATWTNIVGATATSYMLTATAAISGYEYRAVFNSAFGTAATSPATLTISAAPPSRPTPRTKRWPPARQQTSRPPPPAQPRRNGN